MGGRWQVVGDPRGASSVIRERVNTPKTAYRYSSCLCSNDTRPVPVPSVKLSVTQASRQRRSIGIY